MQFGDGVLHVAEKVPGLLGVWVDLAGEPDEPIERALELNPDRSSAPQGTVRPEPPGESRPHSKSARSIASAIAA